MRVTDTMSGLRQKIKEWCLLLSVRSASRETVNA